MHYAAKVKKSPELSVMNGIHCVHAENGASMKENSDFTWRHGLVLADLGVTLLVLMYGLVWRSWGYSELCGLFIIMAAFAALVSGWSGNQFCAEMLSGAKSVLWGAILTGLANGLVVIMENAKIMDTIINYLSELLKHAPSALSAQFMLIVQTLINFLIPSGSGQAAATMPIMAPLGDMLGLSRQVTCLAYQFGDGLSNLLWPTAGIVIICGLGDIPYDRWLKWFGKLFVLLLLAQMVMLQAAVCKSSRFPAKKTGLRHGGICTVPFFCLFPEITCALRDTARRKSRCCLQKAAPVPADLTHSSKAAVPDDSGDGRFFS
jgi:uncharacterized ion transporter superfamily protein YfcC